MHSAKKGPITKTVPKQQTVPLPRVKSSIAKAPFSFGKNWEKFIRQSYSEERLTMSKRWLLEFLQLSDLQGKVFLDIGCGSGIHSLAAWESGAQQVISVDIDPASIRATAILRQSRGNPANWQVYTGSILDDSLRNKMPPADIVYSWGVLHHTGDLWKAIKNSASFLKPKSLFYIALYEKNSKSDYWISKKQKYNAAGFWRRRLMEADYILRVFFWPIGTKKTIDSLRYIITYKKNRGMSFMTDVRDWLGGWPFEPVTAEETCAFCVNRLGLEKVQVKTGEANIEYLFARGPGR